MMKNALNSFIWINAVCMLAALLTFGTEPVLAQGTQSSQGLNFPVPDDWPIEKRGGILGPIPTEEYVSMKVKEIDGEFTSIKADIEEKFSSLKEDLDHIRQKLVNDIKDLDRQGGTQSAAAPDLSGVMSRLDVLEDQAARLERKQAGHAAGTESQMDKLEQKIKSLEKTIRGLQSQVIKLNEDLDYYVQQKSWTQ